jgi:hypothetical protein
MVERTRTGRRGGPNPAAARWIAGGAVVATVLAAALLLVDPLYVVAGLVGIGIVWAVFERPFVGVFLYLVVQYLRPGDLFPVLAPLRPAVAVIGLLYASFFLRLLVRREVRKVNHRILTVFLYFLVVVAVSVPFADFWRGGARDTFFNLGRLGLGIYLLLQLVDTWPKFRGFLWTYFGTVAFLAFWNDILYYGIGPAGLLEPICRMVTGGAPSISCDGGQKITLDTGGSGGMLGGFLGDGNDFSLTLIVLIPVALALYRVETSPWLRRLALAGAVLCAVSVVATTSRGGILGMAAGLIALVVLHRGSLRTVGSLVAVGAGAALLIYLALPTVWDKKFAPFFSEAANPALSRISKLDEYRQDESARGRLDAWGAGLRMFADHPVLGVGAGVFSFAYGMHYKPYGAVTATWREAHSIYFQILGELGTLGVIGMVLIFFTVLTTLFGLRRRWRGPTAGARWVHGVACGLIAGVFAFAAGGAFLSAFYYPHIYMLGTSAVLMALLTRQGAPLPGEPAALPPTEETA